jgi:hypothetical protein
MTLKTKLCWPCSQQHGISACVMRIMACGAGNLTPLAQRKFHNFHGRHNIDLMFVRAPSVRMTLGT